MESTTEWEDYDELSSALDTFPNEQLFAADLKTLLTNQPGFDLPAQIAVSAPFQSAFNLLPKAGRVLYAAVTRFAAAPEFSAALAAYHKIHQSGALPARNQLRKYTTFQPEFEDEMMVWIPRTARLLQVELILFSSLVGLSNHCEKYPGWMTFLPAFQQSDLIELSDQVLENLDQESRKWTYGTNMPTGIVSKAPDSSSTKSGTVTASDGMRFLEAQMRNVTSNYLMPQADSAQQKWVNWFTSVEHFTQMFPTPHHIIVENLRTGIEDSDVRIYGWKARCDRFALERQQRGIKEFLSHVTNQVLNTGTTRKSAWDELQALTNTYSELPDCVAFSARLRNLFQQIFDVTSTEVEPVSRCNVCE